MEKKSEYTFTEPQLAHILALQQQGASLSEIAEEYQVSCLLYTSDAADE